MKGQEWLRMEKIDTEYKRCKNRCVATLSTLSRQFIEFHLFPIQGSETLHFSHWKVQ